MRAIALASPSRTLFISLKKATHDRTQTLKKGKKRPGKKAGSKTVISLMRR
jgi:hypothetical protein